MDYHWIKAVQILRGLGIHIQGVCQCSEAGPGMGLVHAQRDQGWNDGQGLDVIKVGPCSVVWLGGRTELCSKISPHSRSAPFSEVGQYPGIDPHVSKLCKN